jgi:hypothetical protein
MLAALLFGLIVPTNDYAGARHTGLWRLAERFPTMGHTSLLMFSLMMLGMLPVTALLFAIPLRQRIIFAAAIAGFGAANMANNDLFQRYVDPFVLMLLALMSATPKSLEPAPAANNPSSLTFFRRRGIQIAGPLVLGAFFSAISLRDVTEPSQPHYARIPDPPPPPRSISNDPNDPYSKPVPCELPRPPMPPGKHFWPWS